MLEPVIAARQVTSRKAASPTAASDVPVVGPREPCPCGSGRRYKACHGRTAGTGGLVRRPFQGLPSEPEWVVLREVVPAATATLTVGHGEHVGRTATLATVLPMAWPALTRGDGSIFLGLQVNHSSDDVSRDLGAALIAALESPAGTPIAQPTVTSASPRLQDLLGDAPLEVTVHPGFDFWIEGAAEITGEVAESMERANSAVVPTTRLSTVEAAYWCKIGDRSHLRWGMPHEEEPLLDALSRLAATDSLGLGAGTKYVGSFRAHGLLVPVWDLPGDAPAESFEEPAGAFRARLDEALAETGALPDAARRARSGLLGRQLTLR